MLNKEHFNLYKQFALNNAKVDSYAEEEFYKIPQIYDSYMLWKKHDKHDIVCSWLEYYRRYLVGVYLIPFKYKGFGEGVVNPFKDISDLLPLPL